MLTFRLTLIFVLSFLVVKGQQSQRILITENQDVVVAGYYYSASVYLINSKFENVEYYFFDKLIEKDSLGGGFFKFKVHAGAYDKNGKAIKTYKITAKYIENKKTLTISQDFSYTVTRPTLLIDSPVRGILYKNCGNEITVKCPDIGNSFNPICSVSGATIISGSQIGVFTIIPVSESVYLTVSSDGNQIGVEKILSIDPPTPNIQILSDSVEIDIDKPISSKGKLSIKVIPEHAFAKNYPYDARYKVASWSVTVLRNNKELLNKTFTEVDVDFSSLGIILLSGDYLIFNIKEVNRINFLNQIKPENSINSKYITRIP